VHFFKKINILTSFVFILCFVFQITTATAQTYFPVEKNTADKDIIQSVTLKDKTAIIKMSDYAVTVPLTIMHNTEYNRAYGTTPEKMYIGLKYNDIVLQLIAVDAGQKNYMRVAFVTKNADIKKINVPKHYKKEINNTDIYLSSTDFIRSYPLWSPESVARGFDLLSSKEKGIIQLFPAISLELADKLCRSDTVTAGIFELLSDTQKVTCDDLSIFNDTHHYKKLVELANQERSLLVTTLECSQGNRQPNFCQKSNQRLAEKVLHSVTLNTLLKKIVQ
jgi:hypothetical protein